jgi:AcrR family transcriptional regulator
MESTKKESNIPEPAAAQPGYTQARGRARRRYLLDSAREILNEKSIGDVSLQEISDHAGIPISSAYHFYENKNALFAAMAVDFGNELADVLASPYSADEVGCWEDIIDIAIERAANWYAENPSARQLLIGGKASPEIKLSDRVNDERLGEIIEAAIAERFVLPEFENRRQKFFYFVEIADLMMSLSEIYHGEIREEMVVEAKIACKAYLGSFLPKYLTRVEATPDSESTVE